MCYSNRDPEDGDIEATFDVLLLSYRITARVTG